MDRFATPLRPAIGGLRDLLDAGRPAGRQGRDHRLAGSVLAPALRDGVDLALWPFQGKLDELLEGHRFVVAEIYPAEVYGHLGLNLKAGKRKQVVRQLNACPLLAWADVAGVDLDPCLVAEIRGGFGADASGDDRFDAVVGLFGMLGVVLGRRPSGEPDDDVIRRLEGWILGQTC